MTKTKRPLPWASIEPWRRKIFKGEWPTLAELITISAERFANRPCFTDFDPDKNTYTYAQVLEKINQFVQWLCSVGIKKGDCIAVSGKNSPEWAVAYLAAGFVGAIIVPIDYALHEQETTNLLNTAKPKLFFVDEEKYQYFQNNPCGAKIFSLNKKIQETYIFNLKTDKTFTPEPSAENDTAAILFTSGTTGKPKGVMLSHKNLVSDCFIAQCNLLIKEDDVFYALLPIHHAYTMQAAFINPISVGAEIVFGKSMAVSRMLKELREGKITLILGVPLLFNKLLAGILKGIRAKGIFVYGFMKFLMGLSYLIKKLTGRNPGKKLFKAVLEKASISTLRVAICGGGPLAPSIFRTYQELGIDFIQGYGLTETSPIIALNPIEHFKIKSVGRDFSPYMEMKIIDKDEKGIGEVAVKGSMVMQGYYNMPEETAAMFTEDGFLKTGDLGWMDSENYLYLCGRAKNLIVTSGGKNVYPEEIENAFQLYYNDINQITVVGYEMEAGSKSEGIEAQIYPADELIKKLGVHRDDMTSQDEICNAISDIVEKVNKTLQPYARISKITILDKPLEMTTTQKVKRSYKK
ncbi:MAG: AMP-binding protein [Treponemataceae bacterium]|nr:AMP-binding protein [Treponemataceae bacterium]